jgi:hypothetical protein
LVLVEEKIRGLREPAPPAQAGDGIAAMSFDVRNRAMFLPADSFAHTVLFYSSSKNLR